MATPTLNLVGYVYIEESFDTIFNMGYGSGKSPMSERVNVCYKESINGIE